MFRRSPQRFNGSSSQGGVASIRRPSWGELTLRADFGAAETACAIISDIFRDVSRAMPPERLLQVREICRAFLEQPAETRERYLDEVCGNDRELLSEVQARLTQTEATTVLASRPSSLIDQQLNAYRILSFLGVGGMGEVYRAHDTVLGREVAIKTLTAAFACDPERLERLRREARVLASLNHPNIAAIYGLEECRGIHFLVLELVEGETLATRIANQSGTLRETFRICSEIAEALGAAHRKGIVHRDIKPANVKLTPEGRVKVLDFGLAKVLLPDGLAHDRTGTATMATEAGRILGTPDYMSPEQVRGHTLDARVDIWAFGCLAYELLSRKRPFSGGNMAETFVAILEREPSWKSIPAETPQSIVSLLQRCLQKDAQRRPNDLETARRVMEDAATSASVPSWLSLRNTILTGLFLLSCALTMVKIYDPNLWQAEHSGPSVRSLAVLPFVNAGGDPDWDYLADGVTESMINRLSRIRDLTVMSRSAVFRIKKTEGDDIEQGRRLHVDAVMTGSIRHFPDHLEASVELVDCATGRHLWGEHYRQSFIDPLMFEKSAVEDAATQLRARLDSNDKQKVTRNYTANLETYRLYLKGRYEWNKRSVKASEQAIRYFRQALDLDPSNALAYAGIADAYSFESGYLPASDIFPKAQAAALKALELDPDLAEAHASLGFVYAQYGWDWAKAEVEFRRAIQLNPNYPSSHSMYARLLTVLGRFPEAEAEIAKAQTLDPLSPGIATGVALEHYLARDYGRAEKQLQTMLALDPSSSVTASFLALTHAAQGRAKDAILAYERILAADPSDLATMADLVRAYSLAGRKEDAADLMDRIQRSQNYATMLPTSLAEAYGALGRLDKAFAELDRAFSEKCWYLIFLNVEPIFDPLRRDPRFRFMQKKMALAN